MELLENLYQHQELFLLTTAIIGLSVGSFLNVVIYRLPVMLERDWKEQCHEFMELPDPEEKPAPFNLARPASRCPDCGHKIAFWENIPVISYLVLRGKCSSCNKGISVRYPIIEFITGLLSVVIAWHYGFGWLAIAAMVLTWTLIALTMIDYDHQLLPDNIVLPVLWLGILININGTFTDLTSSVIGAVAGYMSLWTIFQLFKILTGKEGMGYGDFKLLAMLGAWLGWQYLLQIILISSLVGAVFGILLVVIKGRDRTKPIPFGPYLATAGWISMIWGKEINTAYLKFAGMV